MKTCKYCGAELKAGQTVCGNCHRKVDDSNKDPQSNAERQALEREIKDLEGQLKESADDENIIHRLTLTQDHLTRAAHFLVHNLLTTMVLLLIAFSWSALRWYAIILIILVTYAYPLLTDADYYPWEERLRKLKDSYEMRSKSKDKQPAEEQSAKDSQVSQPGGKQPVTGKSKGNRDKTIVTVLAVVIVLLIALIIFFAASSMPAKSTHPHPQSTSAQKSSRVTQTSSSKREESTATHKLTPANMDDKLKAAAAYYYASENGQKEFDFKMAVQNNGLTIGKDVSADYQKGSNPVSLLPLKTGTGAVPFYTTDDDTVYFYVPSAMPPEAIGESDDDSDQPVLTATWQEICDLVNQNGAYDQVKQVAANSEETGE